MSARLSRRWWECLALWSALAACGKVAGLDDFKMVDQVESAGGSAGSGGSAQADAASDTGGTSNDAKAGGSAGAAGSVEAGAPCLVTVQAGAEHTCALKKDGSLLCWGNDSNDTLGVGSNYTTHPTPEQVTALEASGAKVSQLAVGHTHNCAILSDSTLWCWGSDQLGAIGDGPAFHAVGKAAQVAALGAVVVDAASGFDHSCAVLTDGTLWCWGFNHYGQLGNGSDNDSNAPVSVATLGNSVKAVMAGDAHTCAQKKDNTLWCWGELPKGDAGMPQKGLTPEPMSTLAADAKQVAVGANAACALKQDGSVWCWGYGLYQTYSSTPVRIDALGTEAIQVVTSWRHICARKSDLSLWCWGDNTYGQLGDGTIEGESCGEGVCKPDPHIVDLGVGVLAVAPGGGHTCALTTDGNIWCWGANGQGQLGDGTSDGQDCGTGYQSSRCKPTPVKVTGLTCP